MKQLGTCGKHRALGVMGQVGILRGVKERTRGEHDQLPLDGGSDPINLIVSSFQRPV